MSSAEDRTIPAGERRIERARQSRGVPVRRGPIAAGALLMGATAAWLSDLPSVLLAQVRGGLAGAGTAGTKGFALGAGDPGAGADAVRALLLGVAAAAWPSLIGGVAGALLGALCQTHFQLRPLLTGGHRGMEPAGDALLGALERVGSAILLGGAAALAITLDWPRLATLPALALEPAVRGATRVVADAVAAALGMGVALAALDVLLARWRWMRALQMTPEQARQEQRAHEGDPALPGRRRMAARKRRADRALIEVKERDEQIA